MNATAERARDIARRKNARRATMIGAVCFALGVAFGWILSRKEGLPLPELYQPVHAVTISGRAKVVYLDENGTFRSVETGEPTQIKKWSKP